MYVSAGNVHDAVPYIDRLTRQIDRFGFNVNHVGLDAGYHTAAISKGLNDRKIKAVFGYRRPTHKKGYFAKRRFEYDGSSDVYRCPEGEELIYKTTNREGYRHYQSNPEKCRQCPQLSQCTKNAKQVKTITRHVWSDIREAQDANRLTEWGKVIYKRRKETVERSFADAKELHQYRYARYRGQAKFRRSV